MGRVSGVKSSSIPRASFTNTRHASAHSLICVGAAASTSAIRALEQEFRYHASVPVSGWVTAFDALGLWKNLKLPTLTRPFRSENRNHPTREHAVKHASSSCTCLHP